MSKIVGFTKLSYNDSHERCYVDVFRPGDNDKAPLVILIHGGGWVGGQPSQYHQTCIELAGRGFATATVGYRLADEAPWPDIAYDVLGGLALLSRQADELGIDASRAVTLGSSAGGHLALVMQAHTARWVAEGLVPAAPAIIGTVAQCPATIFSDPPTKPSQKTLMGGKFIAECSPGHVDPALFKSVLTIHGDADTVIPLDDSRQFTERLRAAGVGARLHVLAGAEHAFGYRLHGEHAQAALAVTVPYLEEVLR